MIVERCRDMERIRAIMTDPRVYGHISDDGSPPASEFRPVDDERIYYLGVRLDEGAEIIGVFMCVPQSSVTLEIHTCLLPALWGRSIEATGLGAEWLFMHTDFARLVTAVPAYNRFARRLALASGMSLYGVNPASIRRAGVLYAQELFGLSKSADREESCRQL